ncbi:MAG: hypothetical protein HQL23_08120, partial [Candidatus Omnitrophica bacterium]|nr:hypothetical protein [Candidatus Omnitrophota bacterium]
MSPRFQYKAKVSPEKTKEGVVDAADAEDAARKIIQLGLTPLEVNLENTREVRDFSFPLKIFPRQSRGIRPADLTLMTRQLSDLLDSVLPLLKALRII